MFAARAILVSLGFLAALYCLLSLLVVCVWNGWNRLRRPATFDSPGLLFALRVFPLAASTLFTLAFALPAFLHLESGAIDEDSGTMIFLCCFVLFFLAGLLRILSAQRKSSQVAGEWLDGARVVGENSGALTVADHEGVPPLVLIGLSRARVLISNAAFSMLSGNELRVALRHELEHRRSRDNLKKLVLHGATFPGMASLENAWKEAAELAADERAVSTQAEALDLAGALVKLAELTPLREPPLLTTALVTSSSAVALRIQRLLAWQENKASHTTIQYYLFPLMLAAILAAAANYGWALLLTHRITEWFIH